MNNIKQKNVIYGRDQKDVLPHGGKGDSVSFSQNSNITDARVNNALQQLLNNDLYLENRIALGMGWQPGPVKPADDRAEEALPDGAKTWSDAGDYSAPLTVYRKVEAPLSASVFMERAGAVRFIAPVGDAVFVGFADRLMYDDGGGLKDCLDGDDLPVAATGYWTGDAGTLFASDSRVYQLVRLYGERDDGVQYMLKNIGITPVSGIRCLSYDAARETLYVGGDGFLARGRYRFRDSSYADMSVGGVELTSDVMFSADEQWGSDDDTGRYQKGVVVNALQLLDASDPSVGRKGAHDDLLAATGGGVYRSADRSFVAAQDAPALSALAVYGTAARNGYVYALAGDGFLYRQAQGMDFRRVVWSGDEDGSSFTNARCLAAHSSGLYVAATDGVYRFKSPEDGAPELELPMDSPATAVAVEQLFQDRIVFAASGSVVYFYQDPADVQTIDFDLALDPRPGRSWIISRLAVQPRAGEPGEFDVYVIAQPGQDYDPRVLAAHLAFDPEIRPDADRVRGMELVDERCAAAAFAGGTCWYAKNGRLCDAQSGQSVDADGSAVFGMEALSGGLVAVGTDMGLQLLDAASGQSRSCEDLRDVRYVAHADGMAYFASRREVYAAHLQDGDLVGWPALSVQDGVEVCGLAASSGRVFVLEKGESGPQMLSAQSYSVYGSASTLSGDEEGDPSPAVGGMGFPVMPYMEEINGRQAVCLSAGAAYGLEYSDGEGYSCRRLDFGGEEAVSAFCKAGPQFFAAVGGEVRQYSTSSDTDDLALSDVEALDPAAAVVLPGVEALAYSGTDATFDMQIYAQGQTGLSVYRPEVLFAQKLSSAPALDDFVMYVDQSDDDENYYAVVAGVGGGGLSVNVTQVADAQAQWNGAWEQYSFADVGDQTNRSPRSLFYLGNSRVYVAYTATSAEQSVAVECLAALPTNSMLSSQLQDSGDFVALGAADSVQIRFAGFSVDRPGPEDGEGLDGEGLDEDGDNEDIDVVVVRTRGEDGDSLTWFRVDTDQDDPSLSASQNRCGISADSGYGFFLQPDCFMPTSADYYICVPLSGAVGVRMQLYSYDADSNTVLSAPGEYAVSGLSAACVRDMLVASAPDGGTDSLRAVVFMSDGKAYTIDARAGQTVRWDDARQQFEGVVFDSVRKFGVNQLVGISGPRVYDFQSGRVYDGQDGGVRSAYFTDNGDSRDYMLVQLQDGDCPIYSFDIKAGLEFKPVTDRDGVPVFEGHRVKLSKAAGRLYAVDMTGGDVWFEKSGHQFELQHSGFDAVSAVDGCVCQADGAFYLCVLAEEESVDPDDPGVVGRTTRVDVYEMMPLVPRLFRLSQVRDTSSTPDAYMPRIVYASDDSSLYMYTRVGLFSSSEYSGSFPYSWPFMADPGNSGDFFYLNFSLESVPRFTQFELVPGGQYKKICGGGSASYGVKITPDGYAQVYSLHHGEELLAQSDVEATDAWRIDDVFFFQKASGGIRCMHGSESFDAAPDGWYSLVVGAQGEKYYFLKDVRAASGDEYADSGAEQPKLLDLYVGTVVSRHPFESDPEFCVVDGYGAALDAAPNSLAVGRKYAGAVCMDDSGVCSMCVLQPYGRRSSDPAGDGIDWASLEAEREYSVLAVPVKFQGLPDGADLEQIVPMGDFLNEIVLYGGGRLHVAEVQDRRLRQDDDCEIPVVRTLPWSELGQYFQDGIQGSALVGGVRYVAGRTGMRSFTDAASGLVMKACSPHMKAAKVAARQFCRAGLNQFMIAASDGVYRYRHVDGVPVVSRVTPSGAFDAACVAAYNFASAADSYAAANLRDGMLYTSDNGRVWRAQFRPTVGRFSSVHPKLPHEWYFGADDGLYRSRYSYAMKDDLDRFSEDDLYALYSGLMSSDLSDMCEDMIAGHESSTSRMDGHVSSLVDDINANLLSVNFDGLQSSGWQRSSGAVSGDSFSVSNDVVFEQRWGGPSDGGVRLSVENMFVQTPDAKFTYLLRRWMSGFTELYVRVPTTDTYYINHVPSTPGWTLPANDLTAANVSQFGRERQVFSHDPNDSYTKMSLALDKSEFSVDALLGVQACGNSLPLKVYRETIQQNGDWNASQYFNSYAAPTVMLGRRDAEDDAVFEFACFGADEQVIALQFMDTVNRFDRAYYRVVFNSNGVDSDPDSFVKQRVPADGTPTPLRKNVYKWPQNQKIFSGWTFTPYPGDNPDLSQLNGFYPDGYELTSGEIESRLPSVRPPQDVKLYAVWMTYRFTAADTTLVLRAAPGQSRFGIGGLGVDDGTALGGSVVVKFEDVVE